MHARGPLCLSPSQAGLYIVLWFGLTPSSIFEGESGQLHKLGERGRRREEGKEEKKETRALDPRKGCGNVLVVYPTKSHSQDGLGPTTEQGSVLAFVMVVGPAFTFLEQGSSYLGIGR